MGRHSSARSWRCKLGLIKDYQVGRIGAFLDPSADPPTGYNTVQARIAIGSGGIFGKGLFHGTQTNGKFVPEHHTDFVFSVAGEELGMVGAGRIVLLLAVLIWRGIRIACGPRTCSAAWWRRPVCWLASRRSRTSG